MGIGEVRDEGRSGGYDLFDARRDRSWMDQDLILVRNPVDCGLNSILATRRERRKIALDLRYQLRWYDETG